MDPALLLLWLAAALSSSATGERYTMLTRWGLGQNYEIYVREFDHCPREEEGERLIHLKVEKVNRLTRQRLAFSGTLRVQLEVNDNLEVVFNMASRNGGTWVENYFNTKPGGMCATSDKLIPKTWKRLLKNIGVHSCPIPPGNYTFNNLDLTPDFHVPVLPLNKYKVHLRISRNSTRVGCIHLLAEVVEKKQ